MESMAGSSFEKIITVSPATLSPVVFALNPFHNPHPLHWGKADTPRSKMSLGCLNKSFFTDNGDADG